MDQRLLHVILFAGKTSISNVSLSSEDSYASTSFPYGDDVKIERSRSLTPSIASDRLSRDDLDQYCSSSVGNSTDNIVELPITVSTNQEAVNVSSFHNIMLF